MRRSIVEDEVKVLVQGAYERAQAILKGYEPELHALAQVWGEGGM